MSKRIRCSVAEYWESSTVFRDSEILILKCPGNVLRVDHHTNDYQLHRMARELQSFTNLLARQEGLAVSGDYFRYLSECRSMCSESQNESALWYIWGAVSALQHQTSGQKLVELQGFYTDYYEFVAEDERSAALHVMKLQRKHDAAYLKTLNNIEEELVYSQGEPTPDYLCHLYQLSDQEQLVKTKTF